MDVYNAVTIICTKGHARLSGIIVSKAEYGLNINIPYPECTKCGSKMEVFIVGNKEVKVSNTRPKRKPRKGFINGRQARLRGMEQDREREREQKRSPSH